MSEALTTPVSTEVSPEAAAPIQPVENAAAQTVQAPAVDQPLTFATQADFDKAVDARLEAVKQQWLNESYQNTQSMNDKFSAQVNAKLQQLQKLGIKADAVQAAVQFDLHGDWSFGTIGGSPQHFQLMKAAERQKLLCD